MNFNAFGAKRSKVKVAMTKRLNSISIGEKSLNRTFELTKVIPQNRITITAHKWATINFRCITTSHGTNYLLLFLQDQIYHFKFHF